MEFFATIYPLLARFDVHTSRFWAKKCPFQKQQKCNSCDLAAQRMLFMTCTALAGSFGVRFAVSASEWNFVTIFFTFYPLLARFSSPARHFQKQQKCNSCDLAACSMVFIDMYCSSSSLLHHKCSFGLRVEFYARNLSPSGPILGEEVPISEATDVQ